jgi:protein involved in polysaccharide export with SLBB domain
MRGKNLWWMGNAVFLMVAVLPLGCQEQQRVAPSELAGPATGEDRVSHPSAVPAGQQSEPGQPTLQRRNPRYRLCKGDVLDLNFRFTPEFNQSVTVQPDVYITLRGLGDLHVEGKAVPKRLSKGFGG